MPAKYPLRALQALWQHRVREGENELRARHSAARDAAATADRAVQEHGARARGIASELRAEQQRLADGLATARDLMIAEAYHRRARAELDALQACAREASAGADAAAAHAQAAAEHLRAARADGEALAGHRARWETEQRRAEETRREETAQEQWRAARQARGRLR